MERMTRLAMLIAVWGSLAGTAVGFVLPWASLEVSSKGIAKPLETVTQDTPLAGLAGALTEGLDRVVVTMKRGTETVTGELPGLSQLPRQINGADVPRLANRPDAKLVMALAEVVTGQRELGAKSSLVYLLPGLALVIGIMVTMWQRARVVCGLAGVACLVVAGVGLWKLCTIKTETLLVAITIGQGLWLSVWSYAVLGASAIALACLAQKH